MAQMALPFAVQDKYRSAALISGMGTFIAAYHYMRIFNSWVDACWLPFRLSCEEGFGLPASFVSALAGISGAFEEYAPRSNTYSHYDPPSKAAILLKILRQPRRRTTKLSVLCFVPCVYIWLIGAI